MQVIVMYTMAEFNRNEAALLMGHGIPRIVSRVSETAKPVGDYVNANTDQNLTAEELQQSGLFKSVDENTIAPGTDPWEWDSEDTFDINLSPDGIDWSVNPNPDGTYSFEPDVTPSVEARYENVVSVTFEKWVSEIVDEINNLFETTTISKRQFQVMFLGGSESDKADLLGISVGTVRSHYERAVNKMASLEYKIEQLQEANELHSELFNPKRKFMEQDRPPQPEVDEEEVIKAKKRAFREGQLNEDNR